MFCDPSEIGVLELTWRVTLQLEHLAVNNYLFFFYNMFAFVGKQSQVVKLRSFDPFEVVLLNFLKTKCTSVQKKLDNAITCTLLHLVFKVFLKEKLYNDQKYKNYFFDIFYE